MEPYYYIAPLCEGEKSMDRIHCKNRGKKSISFKHELWWILIILHYFPP